MRVKSARSIRKGASSGQTAASLVENHARKPPSSALIANHASKPALFEVPLSSSDSEEWTCWGLKRFGPLLFNARLRAPSFHPVGGARFVERACARVKRSPRTYLVFGDIEGKLDVLRVECTKCDRKGRYHVHKLIEKYGRMGDIRQSLQRT